MRIGSALCWGLILALPSSCSNRSVAGDGAVQAPAIALQPTAVLAGHTKRVWHAVFNASGSRIVTSSDDGTARLWGGDGEPLAVLDGGAKTVRSATFSSDGERILTLGDSDDHAVRVWDSSGQELAVLAGHTDTVRSASFSADGKRILTASVDSTARLWSGEGEPLSLLAGHTDSIEHAQFFPGSNRIVTSSMDGTSRVWDGEGKSLTEFEGHAGGIPTISPDGSRILTTARDAQDGIARLWDAEWNEIAVLAGHTSFIRSAAFSPDGSRIATASLDHTARLWDRDGKPLDVLVGHTAEVRHVEFSSDGSRIVTASDDKTARLWSSAGEPLAVFVGHTGRLSHAGFSPDGRLVVSTSEDATARLYLLPRGKDDRSVPIKGAAVWLSLGYGIMPSGMHHAGVRSILEDSKGNFWFGIDHEGVCRFDGESLTYFTEEDGLSNNQVRSIYEDRNGVIWFECGEGLSFFDGEKIVTHTTRNYAAKHEWLLEAGDLWFKGDEMGGVNEREGQPGAYRYDGKEFHFKAFPVEQGSEGDWGYSVTGINQGAGERVWFATYNAVIGYDGESFTKIDDESLGLNEETGLVHIRCVFEDSKGRLWIGNNGIGVILVDGDTSTNFTQQQAAGRRDPGHSGRKLTPQPGDVDMGAPSLHRVFTIGEDRDGNIWFGTVEQGAWRYDGESLRNFTKADGLTSAGIMSVYTDRRGELWLGGDGVFKFNGESFDRVH